MLRNLSARCAFCFSFFFFFNDTAPTEIYSLSLHAALPISAAGRPVLPVVRGTGRAARRGRGDRKSTRLNSSHLVISYAVFCLKKKIKIFALRYPVTSRGLALTGRPAPRARLNFGQAGDGTCTVGLRKRSPHHLFPFFNDTAPPGIYPLPLPHPLPL